MIIAQALLDDVIAHAREEYDAECCGMLAAREVVEFVAEVAVVRRGEGVERQARQHQKPGGLQYGNKGKGRCAVRAGRRRIGSHEGTR